MSKVEAGDVVLKDKDKDEEEEEEEDEDDLPNASTAAAPGQGAGDDLAELENETEQATEAAGALLNEIVQETDEKPQNASSDDSSPVIVDRQSADPHAAVKNAEKVTEVAKHAVEASHQVATIASSTTKPEVHGATGSEKKEEEAKINDSDAAAEQAKKKATLASQQINAVTDPTKKLEEEVLKTLEDEKKQKEAEERKKKENIETSTEFWKAFDSSTDNFPLQDYNAFDIKFFFLVMTNDTIRRNTADEPTPEDKKLVRDYMEAIQTLCKRAIQKQGWVYDCPQIRDSSKLDASFKPINNDISRQRRVNVQDAIGRTCKLLGRLYLSNRGVDEKTKQQIPVTKKDEIDTLVQEIGEYAKSVQNHDVWKDSPTPAAAQPQPASNNTSKLTDTSNLPPLFTPEPSESKLPEIPRSNASIRERCKFIRNIAYPSNELTKFNASTIADFVHDLVRDGVYGYASTNPDAVREFLRGISDYETVYSTDTYHQGIGDKKELTSNIIDLGDIFDAVYFIYNTQWELFRGKSMSYTRKLADYVKKISTAAPSSHSLSANAATSNSVVNHSFSANAVSSSPAVDDPFVMESLFPSSSLPAWSGISDLTEDYPPSAISLKPKVPKNHGYRGLPLAFLRSSVDRESFVPKKKGVGPTKAKTSADEEAKAKHIRKIIDQARAMGYNMTDPTKWNVFPGCLSDGYKLTGVSYSDVLVKLHRNKRLCYLALTILKQEYGYRIPSRDYSAVIRAIERAQETERLEKEEEEEEAEQTERLKKEDEKAKQQAQEEEEEAAERIAKKKKQARRTRGYDRALLKRAVSTAMSGLNTQQPVASSPGPTKQVETKKHEKKDSRLTTPPGNKDQVSLARSTTVDHLRQIRPPLETQKHPSKPVSHSTTWFKPT